MKRRIMRILLITLVVCMTASAVTAAQFGVVTSVGQTNGNDNDVDSNVSAASATDVSWVRDECRWQSVQSTAGGVCKIRAKDLDYIQKVDAAGINQLLILGYSNPVYGVEIGTVPTASNVTYYQAWLDYVRYVVTTVGDYVDAYEVWNEPDHSVFNYNLLATASDYAQLYLDTKAIVDELDPTATVVCGVLAGDRTYGNGIFSYIEGQGNVNQLIDAFSIHFYPDPAVGVENSNSFPAKLSNWEAIFDTYGYTGDVWLTEVGLSAATDYFTMTEQAYGVAKIGVIWENYLKTNNRSGEIIWYDLRNNGTDASNREHNYGIFNNDFTAKTAHYAMKTYNGMTGGKTFVSKTDYKPKSSMVQYNGTNETVYLLWDSDNSGTSRSVPATGDVVYVYDYQGNLTSTVNNPSGNVSVQLYSDPIYVRSVTFSCNIDRCAYDQANATVSVSGTFIGGDSVTVDISKAGNTVKSVSIPVIDGHFDEWFSFVGTGTYGVEVGKSEYTAIGKESGWATDSFRISSTAASNPAFVGTTQISYNASTRKVNVSGTVDHCVDNQQVTILAIPSSMSTSNIDMNAVACVKQVPATNGTFSAEFDVPKYFNTNMTVYLGGTDIASEMTGTASIGEGDYVYVASLDLSKGSTLTATALINNFTQTAKTVTMVVAQYNGDSLVKLDKAEKNIAANSFATLEYTLSGLAIQNGTTHAKAFVWDDLSDMIPLAEFEEVLFN